MTGNVINIARPYAAAAFEYAVEKNEIAAWENLLNSAAYVTQQTAVVNIIDNPKTRAAELVRFFDEVLAKILNAAQKNFLHLLADNKRLPVLPAIATLFTTYREERDRRVTVQVISAVQLEERFKHLLEKQLAKKLNQQVSLRCEVDPAILGGAILRAGDMVIDGSVRGKLHRLLESL